ncbi:carbohydrate ABC transporter permease [Cohnella nanjingensis]|uniref:Carbohydrate ABC transporter permease n=1 Tax=Cohnella nanjingensis TaxID=1387779 RepID=A0A7X0RND2_9BACL|nr:carbohydrate ABC transporter permease [Cohnella nanjingensis]MBB6670468.1 carbohydrate ABC transporter permease [Cohnella nanjingensis]
MRTAKITNRAYQYLLLLLGLLIFIGPLLWLVSTMLKTQDQTYVFPPKLLPQPFTLTAFSRLFETMTLMPRWILNSFVVSSINGLGTIVTSSLIAFGFARMKSRLRPVLFVIVLSTLMIPSQVTLIPMYILFSKIGWYDSWLPLTIPVLLASPYFIFLFRQYFLTLPRELDEATYVDGGGYWTIYSKVILPLSGPILISGFIFSFVFTWTDYFTPLIFIQSEKLQMMSVGLQLIMGKNSQDLPMMAAGSFLALLPIAVIYFAAQKYFVEGVVMSGIK